MSIILSFPRLICSSLLMSVALLASAASAAEFGSGPVRMVVPFSPGGSTDLVARHMAKKLATAIGQTVVVENISGGGTVVGMQSVISAPSDGNTLILTGGGSFTVMRHTTRGMSFDPLLALTPITLVNTLPHWLVVRADRPESTFREFFEMIKKNPGKVSISVNALGGAAHLGILNWAKDNGLDLTVVPYRGSSAAMLDLLGGSTTAHVDVVGSTMSHVTGGKAKALSLLQATPLADFPKFAAAPPKNLGGLYVRGDHVLAVKSGTSVPTINRIYEDIRKIMLEPDFLELLRGLGYEPLSITPAEAKKSLERDSDYYREIVRSTNITVN